MGEGMIRDRLTGLLMQGFVKGDKCVEVFRIEARRWCILVVVVRKRGSSAFAVDSMHILIECVHQYRSRAVLVA